MVRNIRDRLAVVLLLLTSVSQIAAQPVAPTKYSRAESKIISGYISWLNTRGRKDSLLIGKDKYNEGFVTCSPDQRFKIFVIKGEICSMHCECIYSAFLQFTNSKSRINLDISYPVESVFKMKDGKYLIIQKAETCGGTSWYNYKTATSILLKDKSIKYYSFKYKQPVDASNSNKINADGNFSIYQSADPNNSLDQLILRFDASTRRLNYRYNVDDNR